VQRHYADISKARRLLGFDPPIDIESGVFRFIGWFHNHGVAERVSIDESSQPNW